jgi:hypothetical protein
MIILNLKILIQNVIYQITRNITAKWLAWQTFHDFPQSLQANPRIVP